MKGDSMKRLNITAIGLMIVTLFASCEKEIMTYEGQDSLYFDVRWGAEWGDHETQWAHQYFTPVEFGKKNSATEALQLRVMATGTIKDYDRPFKVTVLADSTNAVAGEDYTGFSEEHVIKAGERFAYVDVVINRTERMERENVYLTFLLHANEHFTLPFTNFDDQESNWKPDTSYGKNTNAAMHKVVANNFMVQPDGWIGTDAGFGLFGKFSPKKFRLMMDLTGTDVADYASGETMPMSRAYSISEALARYLLEEAAKGREHAVLDEDGTMMFCMYVTNLGGSRAWQPFTKPEDYYK